MKVDISWYSSDVITPKSDDITCLENYYFDATIFAFFTNFSDTEFIQ
jgi:hypothetical protein